MKRPTVVVSMSGGKDSTATALYLRERGVPFRWVFADTGWEHADTYAYVRDVLPGLFGPGLWVSNVPGLDDQRERMALEVEAVLGVPVSAFVRWCLKKGMFPSRQRRYCTEELKWNPIIEHLATLDGCVVNAIGVRAAESASRARDVCVERHPDPRLPNAVTWRPILDWSEPDVIDMHHRHNIEPNPLYLRQSSRVGCWPCIYARKAELAEVARDTPERIEAIRLLERFVGDLAEQRATDAGTTLAEKGHHRPKLYQERNPQPEFRGVWKCPDCAKLYKGGRGLEPDRECPRCGYGYAARHMTRSGKPMSIDDVVFWATSMDGRQIRLLDNAPDTEAGCMRWGLCDHAAVTQ